MVDEPQPPVLLPYAIPPALDRRARRQGDLVVKPLAGTFPMRCVCCNLPVTSSFRATLRYYPSLRFVYSGVFRNVAIPLCYAHLEAVRRRRWKGVALRGIGVLITLAAIGGIVRDGAGDGWAMMAMFIVGVGSWWGGDYVRNTEVPLRIVRATRTELYFAGAGPEFLNGLTEGLQDA